MANPSERALEAETLEAASFLVSVLNRLSDYYWGTQDDSPVNCPSPEILQALDEVISQVANPVYEIRSAFKPNNQLT